MLRLLSVKEQLQIINRTMNGGVDQSMLPAPGWPYCKPLDKKDSIPDAPTACSFVGQLSMRALQLRSFHTILYP